MDLFTEPADRAKAMGIYGFVCAAGGSIGMLLGGVLTRAFNWHWIFLVNLPLGFVVYALCLRLLPRGTAPAESGRLDVAGAVTITTALMLAIYAIVNGNQAGWTSTQTLGLLGTAALLLVVFLGIEARVRAPLVPLRLFRLRNRRDGQCRRHPLGCGHVRVVLHLRALHAARARLQRRCRSDSPSCRPT